MRETTIKPKNVTYEIMPEQLIPDYVFVNIANGTLRCFAADKSYVFKTGDYFIARENRLAR